MGKARIVMVEALEGRQLFSFPVGIGSTGADQVVGVATDRAGNVFVTGTYTGTVDFDPGSGVAELSGGGGFVARYAADGTFAWARSFVGTTPAKVAVDHGGSVYFAGNFSGTVDFDPRKAAHNVTATGAVDAFACKLTSRGNLVYVTDLGGTEGNVTASGLAVSPSGIAYVGGMFEGRVNFRDNTALVEDPWAMSASDGVADGYIVSLARDGSPAWSGSLSGSTPKTLTDMALDGDGNVLATGLYSGNVDFNPKKSSFTAVGLTQQAYALKWDANGEFRWMAGLGGTGVAYGTSITADRAGNVYTIGGFSGVADFDPRMGTRNVTASGSGQVFVSKLTPGGNYVWAKGIGGATTVNATPGEVAVDKNGDIYTTGRFTGTQDFDPGSGTQNLTSAGANDVFLSVLDKDGRFVRARRFGGQSTDQAIGMWLDRSGDLLVTGVYTGTTNFGPPGAPRGATSAGDEDGFIMRLTGTGNPA